MLYGLVCRCCVGVMSKRKMRYYPFARLALSKCCALFMKTVLFSVEMI